MAPSYRPRNIWELIENLIGQVSPQARNDAFSLSEHAVQQNGVSLLDVVANDQGGARNRLVSVDNDAREDSDLLRADRNFTSVAAVNAWETSDKGARFAIVNGKIAYDASTIPNLQSLAAGETITDTITYGIRTPFGWLSYGTMTITITGSNDGPTITVGSGGSSDATVSEDAAAGSSVVATGALTVIDPDTSDAVSVQVSGVALSGTTGSLATADVLGLLTLTPGQLAADAGSANNLTWSFAGDPASFDYLQAGQQLVLSYTVTANDGHGGTASQLVTITITGTSDATNSAPEIVINAGDSAAAAVAEDALGAISGKLTATDANSADVLTAAVTGVDIAGANSGLTQAAALAMFGVTAGALAGGTGNLDWSFSGTPSDFAYLAQGQTLTLSYTVSVSDGTASDDQVVTITITGDNDAAVITGALTGSVTEDGETTVTGGQLEVNDVDGATTFVAGMQATTYGTFTINNAGAWLFTLNNASAAVNELAEGQTVAQDFTVQSADGTTRIVSINITGSNDAPTVSVAPDTTDRDAVIVLENDFGTPPDGLSMHVSGTLSVTDPDSTAASAVVVAISVTGDQGSLSDSALLEMMQSTDVYAPYSPSNLTWRFSAGITDFDHLAAGEELSLTYTISVQDNEGAITRHPVTITIVGTNDAPTLTVDTEMGDRDTSVLYENGRILDVSRAAAAVEGAFLQDYGTLTAGDVDHASLLATVSGIGVVGTGVDLDGVDLAALFTVSTPLTVGSRGNLVWSFSADSALFDSMQDGDQLTLTYTVDVTDAAGASDSHDVTITIVGQNDAPVAIANSEDVNSFGASILEGNVEYIGDGYFRTLQADGGFTVIDVDHDDSVIQSGMVTHTVDAQIDLSWYQEDIANWFNVTYTGGDPGQPLGAQWSFEADPEAFQSLSAGEVATITYQLSYYDNAGATTYQDVSIQIVGENDDPYRWYSENSNDVTFASLSPADANEAGQVSAEGVNNFRDNDHLDVLTVGAAELAYSTDNLASLVDAGAFSFTAVLENTGFGDSTVAWTFETDAENLDLLGEDQSGYLEYYYTVTDNSGATAYEYITISLNNGVFIQV